VAGRIRFSYVLPAPASEAGWSELARDLAGMRRAGYDAVELQIPDPADFDEDRFRRLSESHALPLCAFQTGGSYATRGNCLCSRDDSVRRRTVALLKSFVDLAARWRSVVVFGSLQGRSSNEPDREAGSARIREAIREVGLHAAGQGVIVAFEPVNHLEVGFHNTIGEVAELVRSTDTPGLRMMIDTFHMNIEEKDPLAPISGLGGLLAHVHLSETNRDVLGAGHWPTADFLDALTGIGYRGYCSVGVYHSRLVRQECIARCMQALRR
jgi:sugar phosphate isomerase/epimerase